jgi:hypothetical protein
MNDRDWDFCIGSLGDPLADIKDWMLHPLPSWMPEWQRQGKLNEGEGHEPKNHQGSAEQEV